MNHLQQMHTMFGGSTEFEACREVLGVPRVAAMICAAACDPRLPANAIGYIAQLQKTESLTVACDAAAMIRRHIPEFLNGIV